MHHSETSIKIFEEIKMQFNGNHQAFNLLSHSAVSDHGSRPSNQNFDLPVQQDTSSHHMQCCLCHSRYCSLQDLHRHYVECHSPHELSLALLQQQCLTSVSKTLPSRVTLSPVENGDQTTSSTEGELLDRPRRYWSGVEDDTAASFSEPHKPGLLARGQANLFAIQGDSCSLTGDYRRDIDGRPLIESSGSPSTDFDVSLRQCTGALGDLAKCPQKPIPQKIMSQMMGMASEDGDDWPDLGDDITLIDDEDLLSSLDLFPNLLDFVIELDAKEESGVLTVQKPELQHCPQKHFGYPDHHDSCQAVGLLHHGIPSPEKPINALQGLSTHECGSHSSFCSDDSASLTHPFTMPHKHLHNVFGAKTLSEEISFDNTRQCVPNNGLLDGITGGQNTDKQFFSNEQDVSNRDVVNDHNTFVHATSNVYGSSQHDLSHEDLSVSNETVYLEAAVECVGRRSIVDPNSLSDPRRLLLNYNDYKSPSLNVQCSASVPTNNVRNENSVAYQQQTPKSFPVNETVSASLKELSPLSQTHDLLHSGMTVPCSIGTTIPNCVENKERLLTFNERVHLDCGQSLSRVAPRFIITQAPTQQQNVDICVGACDQSSPFLLDSAGSTHLGVQTNLSSGSSLYVVSNALKSDHLAEDVPSLTTHTSKQRLSKIPGNVKRRRSLVQREMPQNQFELSTSKLGNSFVTSKKTKVVKTSSGRVVKCKQSDEFIYESVEMGAFSEIRSSVSSKVSINECKPNRSLKLTEAMMGTIELRNSASHSACKLTEKSTNKYCEASVVRLPVYTDPDNDLSHVPELVDKDGRTIAICQSLSSKQTSSFSKADSLSKDARRQQFLCHLCWEPFTVLSALTLHLKASHAEWATCFACRCGSTFASEDAFRVHWRVKHRDFFQVTYTCRVCGQTFRKENAFNAHLRVIHPDYKVICYVCEKRFVNMKSLRVHMAVHTKKQIFVCPYCPKTYLLRYSFNRHFVNHFSNPCCYPCNKRFKSKQSYDDHMGRHRVSKSLGWASTIKCDNCGDLHEGSYVGSDRDSGLGHHKVCILCNKGLYKMFSLANKSHDPSKAAAGIVTPAPESLSRNRQECPLCQSWVLDLTKHVRRVHRQPTVACDVCGAMVKKECLPAHKDRAHARLGGVTCDHCGKLFTNVLSLREHINRVKNKIKSVLVDII